jgi:transcriptional regulatory protein LevR
VIDEKLLILQKQGVISSQAYTFVEQVANKLQEHNLPRQNDVTWMFLAHLATAYMRQVNTQPIEALPHLVKAEVEENPLYPQVVSLWKHLDQESGIRWPDNELEYIFAHLMALMSVQF